MSDKDYKGNKHIPYSDQVEVEEVPTTPEGPMIVPDKNGDLKNVFLDDQNGKDAKDSKSEKDAK